MHIWPHSRALNTGHAWKSVWHVSTPVRVPYPLHGLVRIASAHRTLATLARQITPGSASPKDVCGIACRWGRRGQFHLRGQLYRQRYDPKALRSELSPAQRSNWPHESDAGAVQRPLAKPQSPRP